MLPHGARAQHPVSLTHYLWQEPPLPPSRLPWVLPQPALRALCPGFISTKLMPGRQSVTGGVQPERRRPGCSLSLDSSWFRVGRGGRMLEARCGSAQCQIITEEGGSLLSPPHTCTCAHTYRHMHHPMISHMSHTDAYISNHVILLVSPGEELCEGHRQAAHMV